MVLIFILSFTCTFWLVFFFNFQYEVLFSFLHCCWCLVLFHCEQHSCVLLSELLIDSLRPTWDLKVPLR